MSRTYKDRPSRVRFPEFNALYDTFRIAYEEENDFGDVRVRYSYLKKPGIKTKKKKHVDTEWHWMSTPSWWTRLIMNRPQRRKGRLWERAILFQELEETDAPGVGKKPHQYYW